MQAQESDFLKRSITVSCKQSIVQIGALGWEGKFIDCSLYNFFIIIDAKAGGAAESKKIKGVAEFLPIMTESVDMIIMPHVLEFVTDQHHVLREAARILKPEGKLIILNFNPWRFYVHYQYIRRREKHDPWRGLFLTRSRIIDWLKLLNFEVEIVAGFNFSAATKSCNAEKNKHALMPISYAVRAIKRRYNLIPLTPVKFYRRQFAVVGGVESSRRSRFHE